jgi:hypothetical protein
MHAYELWHNEFPDVNYIGQSSGFGRTQVVAGSDPAIFYSDKGSVMTEAVSDKIYTVMENADYMINIPTLKPTREQELHYLPKTILDHIQEEELHTCTMGWWHPTKDLQPALTWGNTGYRWT